MNRLYKCLVTQLVGVPITEVPNVLYTLAQVGYEPNKISVIKVTSKTVTITAKA